jgi:hypothetical protein
MKVSVERRASGGGVSCDTDAGERLGIWHRSYDCAGGVIAREC